MRFPNFIGGMYMDARHIREERRNEHARIVTFCHRVVHDLEIRIVFYQVPNREPDLNKARERQAVPP